MALAGQGVLAIWNGIEDEAEADFVAWHVREHIPERVAVPGFLRGRRYVAVAGAPKYFNFYELDFGQFGRGLARHSPEKSSTERSFVTSQRHGDMRKVRRCTGRTVRRSDHRGPGRIQGPSRTRLEDVHSTSRPPRRSRSCLSIIPAPDARQVTHKIGQSRAKPRPV